MFSVPCASCWSQIGRALELGLCDASGWSTASLSSTSESAFSHSPGRNGVSSGGCAPTQGSAAPSLGPLQPQPRRVPFSLFPGTCCALMCHITDKREVLAPPELTHFPALALMAGVNVERSWCIWRSHPSLSITLGLSSMLWDWDTFGTAWPHLLSQGGFE